MNAITLLLAFRVTLILLDAGWGIYLVWLPTSEALRSPIWAEAINLVPFHDLHVLGLLFLIGPLLAGGSAFLSAAHVVGRVGWVLASLGLGVTGACWGLTAVSWTAAAAKLGGLGLGSAWLAFGLLILHYLLSLQRQHTKFSRRASDVEPRR